MKIFSGIVYNGDFVLNVDDILVKDNSLTVILGENGSGKSTFAKSIVNKKIKCDIDEIALLNQKPYIYNNKVIDIVKNVIKWNNSNIAPDEFLYKYGLIGKQNMSAKKLSGGEFRRLVLGLILCTNNKLIILDEPFVGIDINSQKYILDILNKEKKTKNIILITHKINTSKLIGDYFIFMEKGNILHKGYKNEFFKYYNKKLAEFIKLGI